MISLEKQNKYREFFKKLKPGYKTSGEIYESLVASLISPKARLLDAGCGRVGVIGLFKGKVGLAVGIDGDFPSLLENKGLDCAVLGDLTKLPFANNSFDIVLSSWVIEHLRKPGEAFSEVARVLRKGGHFVFLTPNARNYVVLLSRLVPSRLQRLLVPKIYGRKEADTFSLAYRANTRRKLEEELGRVGLRNEEFYYIGDPSYIAFNDFFFNLGCLIERITDHPLLRSLKVHLVASYVKV